VSPTSTRLLQPVIGAAAVCHDVSELSYAASHDALTGLINRREFLARLEHAVARAHVDLAEHALCCIDLDQCVGWESVSTSYN